MPTWNRTTSISNSSEMPRRSLSMARRSSQNCRKICSCSICSRNGCIVGGRDSMNFCSSNSIFPPLNGEVLTFLRRCSSSSPDTNLSVLERLPVAAYQVDEGLQERPRDRLPDQILGAVQGPLQVGRHVARERREVVEGGVHFLRVFRLHVDINQWHGHATSH